MSEDLTIAEQMTQHALERCVHFTGIQNVTCKAGVLYESVEVNHEPIAGHTRSRPCNRKLNHCNATCEKSEFRSLDAARVEGERRAAEIEDSIKFTGLARKAILAQTGNRGGSGTVECPKCSGKLHYGQASTNKHIHASCETPKCLEWME
jgi:hypothetical protein